MTGRILIAVLVLCAACRERFLDESQLEAYTLDEKNGLRIARKLEGVSVDVLYKPSDLMVAREFRGRGLSIAQLDSARSAFGRRYYFVVGFSSEGDELLRPERLGDGFAELVATMSFRMADHVYLTTGARDTIPVSNYVLDRTFGIARSTNLLFVFDNQQVEAGGSVTFHINEFGLGVGHQSFEFDSEKIQSVPSLKFNILLK